MRDAALNWQQTFSDHLVEAGFKRGVGHPSVFHHPTKDIWALVHGDYYCSAGSPASLDWLEDVLVKKCDIKTQRMREGNTRTGESKKQEGQVINHVVRRMENGWELEADLRHAELIDQELGLIDCNIVSMPDTAALTPLTADDEGQR